MHVYVMTAAGLAVLFKNANGPQKQPVAVPYSVVAAAQARGSLFPRTGLKSVFW